MSYMVLGLSLLITIISASSNVLRSKPVRWTLVALPVAAMALAMPDKPWLAIPCLVLFASNCRLLLNRYGDKRERRLIIRSAKYLTVAAILIAALELTSSRMPEGWLSTAAALTLLAVSARAFALAVLRTGARHDTVDQRFDYPTVTLAIPARNETHALTDTLRAALASDYPKLEILVLDDCSHDSTPDIIRSFAHDGVRFIQGSQPDSGWVGKNRAYEQLLEEASGDLVLFTGVDVRMQPGSVRRLVHFFHRKRLKLLSVMPVRRHFDITANLFRPLRYYWQLAFAPWPFISSCWLVDREWLLKQKGFASIKHEIRPEHVLAAKARAKQVYAFMMASGDHAPSTRKRPHSLYETAVRTIYPIHKKEPVLVFLSLTAVLGVLFACLLAWFNEPTETWMFVRFATLLLLASYALSEQAQQGNAGLISFLLAPIAMLSEVAATLLSMIRYELGRVDWKGRNVCLPVMHQRSRERG